MRTAPARIRCKSQHIVCIRVILAAFLVRALIPVGFMPASLDTGGPFIVCHGGTAGTFLRLLADDGTDAHQPDSGPMHGAAHTGTGHSDHASLIAEHGTDHEDLHASWDSCPTGVTAGSAALAPVFSIALLALSHQQPEPEPRYGIPVDTISSYQARAPPVTRSRSFS